MSPRGLQTLAESRWISYLYTSYICSGHGRDDGHFRVFQPCAICKIGLILDKSAHHLQSQVRNLVPLSGMILECSKAFRRVALAPNMGCLDVCNEMNRDKGDLDVNRFGSFAPKTSILSSASRHCMTVHHFSCGPSVPGLLLVMAPGAVGVRPHGYPRLSGCEGDARKRHAPNGFRFFQVL